MAMWTAVSFPLFRLRFVSALSDASALSGLLPIYSLLTRSALWEMTAMLL
jgi:hypothetical protein